MCTIFFGTCNSSTLKDRSIKLTNRNLKFGCFSIIFKHQFIVARSKPTYSMYLVIRNILVISNVLLFLLFSRLCRISNWNLVIRQVPLILFLKQITFTTVQNNPEMTDF